MFQVQQTSRVATSTSTPPRNFIICGLMLNRQTPPANECSGICCNHGRFANLRRQFTGRGKNERAYRTTPLACGWRVIRCCNSGSVKPVFCRYRSGRWPSGRGLPAPQDRLLLNRGGFTVTLLGNGAQISGLKPKESKDITTPNRPDLTGVVFREILKRKMTKTTMSEGAECSSFCDAAHKLSL